MYFIDVILPLPLKNIFTYKISNDEFEFLQQGVRVVVPFGKSKIYTAVVLSVHKNSPEKYEAKEIYQILDEFPIISNQQLELWKWISSYYMCSLGEVLKAALPGNFLLESESFLKLNEDIEGIDLSQEDKQLLHYFLGKSSVSINELQDYIGKSRVLKLTNSLIERNILELELKVYEKYTPKLIRWVKLNDAFLQEDGLSRLNDILGRAKKQKEFVLKVFSSPVYVKEGIQVIKFCRENNFSSSIVKTLIDRGVLEDFFVQEDRFKISQKENKVIQLSKDQQVAYDAINNHFETKSVVLLHGVTSSGKTEVYIKQIEQALSNGGQVLYLLPEIALTVQLVQRISKVFGDKVLVYHSKFNLNERYETWNKILNYSEGESQIIIGARSTVLLPFKSLKLIIIDEEHEQSFKQFDPAPRYHSRDSAIVLGNLFKAKILLGSATPSIETYFNATKNKYGLVTLAKRFNNVLMPEIELVDLKDKYKRKRMKGHFSDRLIYEMNEAFSEGKQVILFQNRRGYSPTLECKTCGHSPQCPNCDVSLTVHKYHNQLRCHYCSYNIALPQRCGSCHSVDLNAKGLGTEQIEEEFKNMYPEVKVARLDLETTRGKLNYEKIISDFAEGNTQCLVGTQMLTKGLDFKNVILVGVLNADNMLNFPDFRAHERTFQLLQQVSGRAGRHKERGKVIIQAFNPNHVILQQVSTNSFDKMFKEQLEERYNFKYPPFFRVLKITFKHKDYNKVNVSSEWFKKALDTIDKKVVVLGPEFPPVSRVRNQYLKNIILKYDTNISPKALKKAIERIFNSFESISEFRSVRVIFDVDTY